MGRRGPPSDPESWEGLSKQEKSAARASRGERLAEQSRSNRYCSLWRSYRVSCSCREAIEFARCMYNLRGAPGRKNSSGVIWSDAAQRNEYAREWKKRHANYYAPSVRVVRKLERYIRTREEVVHDMTKPEPLRRAAEAQLVVAKERLIVVGSKRPRGRPNKLGFKWSVPKDRRQYHREYMRRWRAARGKSEEKTKTQRTS